VASHPFNLFAGVYSRFDHVPIHVECYRAGTPALFYPLTFLFSPFITLSPLGGEGQGEGGQIILEIGRLEAYYLIKYG
jgi:hypothetical protein